MECRYCARKISPEDPLYPNIHYECANKVYKDLERFKMMRVIKIQGMLMQFEIRRSFINLVNEEMKDIHSHVVTDDTVDEDILELHATIKVVLKRVPKETQQEKIVVYCETVFNGLMTLKYGSPVPESKKFHSRMKEFAEEVYTIAIDKEQYDFMKLIGHYAA